MDGLLNGHVLRLFIGETTVEDLRQALRGLPGDGVLGEASDIVSEDGDETIELCFDREAVNDISLPV